MQIPHNAIGLEKPQMSLVNFCRTRRIAPGETSAWSKTFGIFHNPARFGRLVYAPPGGPSFTALSLRHPRIGENQIDVTVAGAKARTHVVVKGYVSAKGKTSCFGVRKPTASSSSLRGGTQREP